MRASIYRPLFKLNLSFSWFHILCFGTSNNKKLQKKKNIVLQYFFFFFRLNGTENELKPQAFHLAIPEESIYMCQKYQLN